MARRQWRPRQEHKLSPCSPGPLHHNIQKYIDKVRKLLPHPVWGIMVATLIAFSGRGELQLRSVGLLLVSIWLSIDLWSWLLGRKTQWKFVIGWAATSATLIGVMGIMYWWLDGKLQDQRDNAFQNLTAGHRLPPGVEDDPTYTMFSVINGGSFDISKHRIICHTTLAVGNNGTSEFRGFNIEVPHSDSVLKAGGDVSTDQCLHYHFEQETDCADVTLVFRFSLDTQPNFEQEKLFRFIAYKGRNGNFEWYGEPQEEPGSRCEQFLKPVKPGG
jgi:hypothetical protein